MKAKIIVAAIVTSLLLSQAPTGLTQKRTNAKQPRTRRENWYVFVSPNGDFTISFPERPNREPDGEGPVTPIQSYGLYTQTGMRFSINFQGTSGDPNAPLHNEWNDDYERDLLAKDRDEKRRVVTTRRIGKNTFEAEIWDSSSSSDSGDSLNYIRQTILRQGRIYTLLCGSEIYGRPLNKTICRRFLGSLRFLPNNSSSTTKK